MLVPVKVERETNMLHLDSKLDLEKTRNEIEQTRIKLDTLIHLEDSSSSAMEDFKNSVEQINQILAELHSSKETSIDSLLQKSSSLKQIGNLLINSANKYQESFNRDFLQQIIYCGLWFVGTGKLYAIQAFIEQVSEPHEDDLIQLIKLNIDFVENYWSTHPEKIIEKEESALQISEADKHNMLNEVMLGEVREIIENYIKSVSVAADKVRLRKLKDSAKNTRHLINWMINSPKWQGDDLDECLEIVENTRVQAEF